MSEQGNLKDALAEVDRLQLEVERERMQRNYIGMVAQRDISRLRDLLGRLEWAGTHPDMIAEESAFCLICMGWRHIGHNPGCELATELHPRTREGTMSDPHGPSDRLAAKMLQESPDRLAAITEHLTDHQDIHEDDGWWLLGKLKEWRTAAGAEAFLADERGREVTRLRALLEPSVTMTSPHVVDPGTQEAPASSEEHGGGSEPADRTAEP